MDFKTFVAQNFNGDEEKAHQHLVNESYYGDYSITGSRDNLKTILDTMTREEAKVYMRCFKDTVKKDKMRTKDESAWSNKYRIASFNIEKFGEKSVEFMNGGNEKKDLDIKTVKKEVVVDNKLSNLNMVWGLTLIFAVIGVICSLAAGNAAVFVACGFAFVIGMFVVTYLVLWRKKKTIENHDFFLVEDTCIKKEFIEGDSDADARYILFFQKNGKYTEYHGKHYAKISVGDRCYLLFVGGSKKVYWATNTQDWDGLAGFEKRGEAYYPEKG